MKQRTEAWYQARLGKVTTSRFKDVLVLPRAKTAKEAGELSATAREYMLDLIAERLTREPQGPPTNWAMQWGIDHERMAIQAYADHTGNTIHPVGFVRSKAYPDTGGSPDGLIGNEGGLEVKCPASTRVHLGYLLDDTLPKEYEAQVQGCMWVTERKWWDFVSFDPRLGAGRQLFILRVEKSDEWQERWVSMLDPFLAKLKEAMSRLSLPGRDISKACEDILNPGSGEF